MIDWFHNYKIVGVHGLASQFSFGRSVSYDWPSSDHIKKKGRNRQILLTKQVFSPIKSGNIFFKFWPPILIWPNLASDPGSQDPQNYGYLHQAEFTG